MARFDTTQGYRRLEVSRCKAVHTLPEIPIGLVSAGWGALERSSVDQGRTSPVRFGPIFGQLAQLQPRNVEPIRNEIERRDVGARLGAVRRLSRPAFSWRLPPGRQLPSSPYRVAEHALLGAYPAEHGRMCPSVALCSIVLLAGEESVGEQDARGGRGQLRGR
jgi:hypothetical protein